tara:strand:- start:1572 stop:2021 length:450 start_codon:yes stop_codon:yes gene_type:complete
MSCTLYCKDGFVLIEESHIQYFETILNQLELCENQQKQHISFKNLEKSCVQNVYSYLLCLLDEKYNVLNNDYEYASLLMTADFLMCQVVLNDVIHKIQNIVKNAENENQLRSIFCEENQWNNDTYTKLKKEDEWCSTSFKHCKSKYLVK